MTKLVASRDEGRAGRAQAPEDHDGHDPTPRPDAGEHHVRRHLEQHVAPEERARAEAVRGGRQPQGFVHRQRGEGNVERVEHVDQIAKAEQRTRRHATLRIT